MASTGPIDIYNTPAAHPPPGVVPNLKHPQTPYNIIILIGVIFLSITSAAVILRIFIKVHLMRHVRTEDCKLFSGVDDRNRRDSAESL